jgi:hypothetical protein
MSDFTTGSTKLLPYVAMTLPSPCIGMIKNLPATLSFSSETGDAFTVQFVTSHLGTHVAIHVTAGLFVDHQSIQHLPHGSLGTPYLSNIIKHLPPDFNLMNAEDRLDRCHKDGLDFLTQTYKQGIFWHVKGMYFSSSKCECQALKCDIPPIIRAMNEYNRLTSGSKEELKRIEALTVAAEVKSSQLAKQLETANGLVKTKDSEITRLTGLLAGLEAENTQLRDHVRQSAMALTLLQRPQGLGYSGTTQRGPATEYPASTCGPDIPDDVSVVQPGPGLTPLTNPRPPSSSPDKTHQTVPTAQPLTVVPVRDTAPNNDWGGAGGSPSRYSMRYSIATSANFGAAGPIEKMQNPDPDDEAPW